MTALSKLDEYPIHQTSEPVLLPATSDRNFYDRNWFCGFSPDGAYYFGFTLGLYPNRGVIDAGFSFLDREGVQHSLLASGRIPTGRLPMRVGPVLLHVEEPLQRIRVTIDDNPEGISADLVFSTRTAAVTEPRQVMWSGSRRTTDATRFNQYGRWSGSIRIDDRVIEIDDKVCHGVKDRSWGVRVLGAPETQGPVPPTRPLFLWTQLFWDDYVTHTLAFDDANGAALVRDAAQVPLYESQTAVPDLTIDPREQRLSFLSHHVDYTSGTRWPSSARIELAGTDLVRRTLQLEPFMRFHQRGLGYGHQRWPHGEWRGESLEREQFRPDELDPAQRQNLHVQQLVRASDGARTGVGIMEHFMLGPYKPAGFGEL